MKAFLRKHAAGLVLAALSGLILGSPHLRPEADRAFLEPDEWIYAAVTETVRSGQWDFSEIYIREHSEDPWHLSRSLFWVTGGLARLVGGTGRLFVLADFVLPPAVFFGLYLALVWLNLPRSVALLAASLYVLHHGDAYNLILPATRYSWWELFRWFAFPLQYGSALETTSSFALSRFAIPLLPRALEVGFLLLLFPALRDGSKRAIVAAGLSLALIIVMSFFDWTVLVLAIGFATAMAWWKGSRRAAGALIAVLGIAWLAAAPYWFHSLSSMGQPGLGDGFLHSGILRTRDLLPRGLEITYPLGPLCLGALLAACPLIGMRTAGRAALASLVLSLAAATSYQVVTGWTMGPVHYQQQHVLPIATTVAGIGACLLAFRWLPHRVARGMVAAAAGASVLHAGMMVPTIRIQPESSPADLREAMEQVEPGAVVLSFHPKQAKVANPRAWSFLTYAGWSAVPTEELMERTLMALKLFRVDRAAIASLFEPGLRPLIYEFMAGVRYHHYAELGRYFDLQVYLPLEQQERWLAFYDGLPDDPDALVARIRERYRLDYVLVSPLHFGSASPAAGQEWRIIHRGAGSTLYKVLP